MPESADSGAPVAGARIAPEVVIAVDFGLRRIGLALGDTLTARARPLATLSVPRGRAPGDAEVERIVAAGRAAGATRIVVGCPYNEQGGPHPLAEPATRFAAALGRVSGCPVHLVDERHSSLEAAEALRERRASGTRRGRVTKPDVDGAAAAVILERWMAGEGDR
jgi:putative Holliday junction resolvase